VSNTAKTSIRYYFVLLFVTVALATTAQIACGQTIDPTPPPAPAQMGQPPQPGQVPNYGILVGPAATRYLDLLQSEDKLTVARYQITVLLAVGRLQAALTPSSNPVPPDQLQTLAGDVVRANAALDAVVKVYLSKYLYPVNPDPACTVDFDQKIVCPVR
jgi:hypothetical protein